ncbi:MAG: glycosyltransferase [Bacteroidota bacterium]|nr:glycosyltransferase [Bacteroidota bacterium]
MKQLIVKIVKFFVVSLLSPVIIHRRNKNAYLAYLPEPYKRQKDEKYLNQHQNRKESIIIGEIFIKLGWGIRVERFDKWFILPKKYELIFGLEPNFIRASKLNERAIKIYYATGSYYLHQNSMIKQRTDEFNKIHQTKLAYQRLIKPHNACEIADYIFQIGSSKTISTYPNSIKNKIILIRQTCFTFNDFRIETKLNQKNFNSFIWMGSTGSILKGLDLFIDFALINQSFNFHIVGNIDDDFFSFYHDKIINAKNIFYHGFIQISDLKLLNIASACSCIIFPSCSEGMPGSVVNLMKLGLIPVVSKWCSFDEIEDLGYELENLTLNELSKFLNWYQSLSTEKIKELFVKNYNYANNNYNKEVFEKDITNALLKVTNC